MARVTIEDCQKQVGNRFNLVLMAAIRTKQLMRGATPLVQAEENKPVVVSLREVAAGFVLPDFPPEAEEIPEALAVATPSEGAAAEEAPEASEA